MVPALEIMFPSPVNHYVKLWIVLLPVFLLMKIRYLVWVVISNGKNRFELIYIRVLSMNSQL